MPWTTRSDGWELIVDVDAGDAPEDLVWEDNFLKLLYRAASGSAVYRVRVDQRRKYQLLEDPRWLVLFFGKSDRLRYLIRGQRLWRDKHIVLYRYGRKPRGYFIVAR